MDGNDNKYFLSPNFQLQPLFFEFRNSYIIDKDLLWKDFRKIESYFEFLVCTVNYRTTFQIPAQVSSIMADKCTGRSVITVKAGRQPDPIAPVEDWQMMKTVMPTVIHVWVSCTYVFNSFAVYIL